MNQGVRYGKLEPREWNTELHLKAARTISEANVSVLVFDIDRYLYHNTTSAACV